MILRAVFADSACCFGRLTMPCYGLQLHAVKSREVAYLLVVLNNRCIAVGCSLF